MLWLFDGMCTALVTPGLVRFPQHPQATGAASKEQGPALIKHTLYFKCTQHDKFLGAISINGWCNTLYFNVNLLSNCIHGSDQDGIEPDCQ